MNRAAKSLTADYADDTDSNAGGSIATDLHRWNTDVERESPTAVAAALRAARALRAAKRLQFFICANPCLSVAKFLCLPGAP